MNKQQFESWQKTIILLGMLGLIGFMWFSLANEVKSGKPFELDKKWYRAIEVQKP